MLKYADKEKALNFISVQSTHLIGNGASAKGFKDTSVQSTNLIVNGDIDRATKVIKNFNNPIKNDKINNFPSISERKLGRLVDRLNQTGLAKDVVIDQEEFDRVLAEEGEREQTPPLTPVDAGSRSRDEGRRGERSEEKSESDQIAEAKKEVDINPSEAQKYVSIIRQDVN